MKSLSFELNATPTLTHTAPAATTVSLHRLVNNLMNSFIPLAVAQKSFIINDIDASFQLQADEQVLAYVVGNLLNNAITCSKSACIRVEAVKKPEGVQIRVRNNGANFYSTVAHGFSQVVAAARSLGGNINIYNQRHEGTIITFSMAA
jgi:C4-dicarboxylate-specific signal transduction histidine kinase